MKLESVTVVGNLCGIQPILQAQIPNGIYISIPSRIGVRIHVAQSEVGAALTEVIAYSGLLMLDFSLFFLGVHQVGAEILISALEWRSKSLALSVDSRASVRYFFKMTIG